MARKKIQNMALGYVAADNICCSIFCYIRIGQFDSVQQSSREGWIPGKVVID